MQDDGTTIGVGSCINTWNRLPLQLCVPSSMHLSLQPIEVVRIIIKKKKHTKYKYKNTSKHTNVITIKPVQFIDVTQVT